MAFEGRTENVSLTNSAMVFAPAIAIPLLLVCFAGNVLYNLYLHPLAGFPGPLLARSTLLWRLFHSMSGKFHIAIDRQHKRYGSVFRVSPNELSFASVDSWKAIYGHAAPGQPTLVKSEFYELYGSGFRSLCIGSERDPRRHARMRKSLSAAFSTKALSEQEHIVDKIVTNFVARIGELGGRGTTGLDMTKWYEMVSFDVLGDMAFGESFHSLENGVYPIIPTLARILFPSSLMVKNKNSQYSRELVARRLERKSPRKDFISNLVTKYESGELEKEELTAHSSTLVIAGGETTATFLAATTFYLLKNPKRLAKLVREIRTRFATYESINATAAQQLPYLQAVISEGLRIYPPGSQGFPRVSPGVVIDGHFVPKGTEVYTSAWTVTHDEKHFDEPMVFKPERWLDPESKDVKEASQPFSLGPRGCLGRNFAYMQINLLFAKMLWKYDLELLNPELDWQGQSRMFVMWWKPKAIVRFAERSDL